MGMFGEVSWEDQRWQVGEEFDSVASEIVEWLPAFVFFFFVGGKGNEQLR